MVDYYKCEECGKIFNEFEMNYKATQEDKKILCRECRNILYMFPEGEPTYDDPAKPCYPPEDYYSSGVKNG